MGDLEGPTAFRPFENTLYSLQSQEATKKCGYYYIEPNSDREKENDGQQKCPFYILNFCN